MEFTSCKRLVVPTFGETYMNTEILKLSLATILLCSFSSAAFADGQDEPIPSFYEEPGLSRNRDFTNQHANERIDPATGKLQWHYVDLFIPGNGGLDLKVQRSYTSPYVPDFSSPPWEPTVTGLGWTMHFGRVQILQEDLLAASLANASVVTLYLSAELNQKLRPKLLAELKPGVRVVSHHFDMGDWVPEQAVSVDGEKIFLWRIPPGKNQHQIEEGMP